MIDLEAPTDVPNTTGAPRKIHDVADPLLLYKASTRLTEVPPMVSVDQPELGALPATVKSNHAGMPESQTSFRVETGNPVLAHEVGEILP